MGKPRPKAISQYKKEREERREERNQATEELIKAREALRQRIVDEAPAKGVCILKLITFYTY